MGNKKCPALLLFFFPRFQWHFLLVVSPRRRVPRFPAHNPASLLLFLYFLVSSLFFSYRFYSILDHFLVYTVESGRDILGCILALDTRDAREAQIRWETNRTGTLQGLVCRFGITVRSDCEFCGLQWHFKVRIPLSIGLLLLLLFLLENYDGFCLFATVLSSGIIFGRHALASEEEPNLTSHSFTHRTESPLSVLTSPTTYLFTVLNAFQPKGIIGSVDYQMSDIA